jgi:flagellar motor component MotA
MHTLQSFNFTHEEKMESITVIIQMLKLVKLASQKGLLSLGKENSEEPDAFLHTGISLIADGIEPKIIEKILSNLLMTSDYTGINLLSKIIMYEGILCIQEGWNPHLAAKNLLSILGEKYLTYFDEVIRS